jgi:two-component system sensor histidine kinase YesM
MRLNRWLKFIRDLKLKEKLFLSYIIVSIIPITILGAYSYTQSKKFLREQAVQAIVNQVKNIGNKIVYETKKYDESIGFLVFDDRMQKIINNYYTSQFTLWDELTNYLDNFVSLIMLSYNNIDKITIYSKTGLPDYKYMINSYDEISNESWARETSESNTTNHYYNDGSLLFTKNIIDTNTNRELGIIVEELDPSKFFSECIEVRDGYHAIVIADSENNIVFSRNTLPDNIPNIPSTEFIDVDEEITKYSDSKYVIIKDEVFKSGWTLCYYVPSSMIAIHTDRIIVATMLIIVLCIIILFLVIYFFSNTIVEPIQHLNKTMKEVQESNLSTNISSSSKDEIGELTNSFAEMLNRINHLINEVYKSKITQKEIELRLLQVCINPHFLYNSLSIINWKAIEIDASEISVFTTTLSNFYRTTLNRGEEFTPFRNEFINARSYIDIQLVMHDYSFDIEYSIDENIYEYYTLNMTLQPIIENAIVHGIDKKRSGRGAIKIIALDKKDLIEIQIIDNGPGIDHSIIESSLVKQSKGYGLRNVEQRIKLFFGERYGIKISSEPDKETSVFIILPKYIPSK